MKINQDKFHFFYADSNEEMQTELSKFSYTLDDIYYAAYAVFLDEKILPSDKLFPIFKEERLYMNCGFGNMTFAFAMNTLCHEMIHQYDFHFGDIAKKKFYEPNVDDHSTIIFQKYMKLANSKGMNVMTSGTGKSFKRMNKKASDIFLMNENDDEKWLDLIARLKNGEKIPGFGYKDGCLVIIPN